MTRRAIGVLSVCLSSYCAEPPVPRAPSEPEGAARAPAALAQQPPANPSSTAARPATLDAALPPLSTPNAPAPTKADSGADAEVQASDPRTLGIRRIALAAQDCHARLAPGIKGHLTLRIAPDHTGTVARVSVVRAQTSPELALPAFETCVLEAVKKERLTPARDEDDELELPLTFEPNP